MFDWSNFDKKSELAGIKSDLLNKKIKKCRETYKENVPDCSSNPMPLSGQVITEARDQNS